VSKKSNDTIELELPSYLEVRDQGTVLEIVRRWSGWERIPFKEACKEKTVTEGEIIAR